MIVKSTKTIIGDFPGNKPLPETTHCVPKRAASLSSEIRKEKVRGLRQQLAEGKYDINKRLDVASGKLLEVLIT